MFSQNEYKFFVGAGIGMYDYSHVRAGIRYSLVDEKYAMELSYNTNFSENLLQLKMGFRLFQIRKQKIKFHLYLPPYLNLNLNKWRYNTPFCFEIFKEEFLGLKMMNYSINVDIFSNKIVPQIRFTVNLFRIKEKE